VNLTHEKSQAFQTFEVLRSRCFHQKTAPGFVVVSSYGGLSLHRKSDESGSLGTDFGLVWLVEFRWKLIRYRWILKWYGTLLIFIVIDIAWFWLKGFKSTLPCVVFGGPIQQRNRRFFWALEILRTFFNWNLGFFRNPTAQRLKIHPTKPPFPLDHWVSSEFRD